jgi:hypothetical protein
MFPIDFTIRTRGLPTVWVSQQAEDPVNGWFERPVMVACVRCSGFNAETAPLVPVARTEWPFTDDDLDANAPIAVEVRLGCGHVAFV